MLKSIFIAVSLSLLAVTQTNTIKIHLIGDSTVQNYNSSSYPQMGWGQVLQLFFDETKVQVENHAIGGRSSRSFHEEGRWTPVRDALNEGDYVFIQFGHNDRDWTKPERYTDTTEFKEYLRIYIDETRDQNAIPVLVSPMVLNAWRGSTKRNVFTEGENDYRGAMLNVANEKEALFIDLNMMSYSLVKDLGATQAAQYLFLGLEAGEYPNFPDGISDGTHFQEMGALTMSRLITDGIESLPETDSIMPLSTNLVPTYQLNVNKTSPYAGLTTMSGEFPAGAHVTIKTDPAKRYTFLRWEDGQNETVTEEPRMDFIMEETDYTFTAVFEDCAGTAGGSAFIDNCATCVDGVVIEEACLNGLEIESACYQSGTLATRTEHELELEYTTLQAGAGDTIHYAIHAAEDGEYKLGIKYLGSADGQQIHLYLNSFKQLPALTLQEAPTWQIASFDVSLIRGSNNVSLVFPQVTNDIEIDLLTTYHANLRRSFTCDETIELLGPLGSENFKKDQFKAYPMPFTSAFRLSGKDLTYKIFSLDGQIIEKGHCSDKCAIGTTLKAGTYLLKASNEKANSAQLIIKK